MRSSAHSRAPCRYHFRTWTKRTWVSANFSFVRVVRINDALSDTFMARKQWCASIGFVDSVKKVRTPSDRSWHCGWIVHLGDDCEFLHEYDMTKMPECYFFSKFGQCMNKECAFLHLDPESKIKGSLCSSYGLSNDRSLQIVLGTTVDSAGMGPIVKIVIRAKCSARIISADFVPKVRIVRCPIPALNCPMPVNILNHSGKLSSSVIIAERRDTKHRCASNYPMKNDRNIKIFRPVQPMRHRTIVSR